ncbi:MAG TPA: T9SS type A sorting domain-containing protein [Chitinophagaceae bacterium]|nr:T9SS type A sorting domain-containing protein [Chitinophagaceae bacterium]
MKRILPILIFLLFSGLFSHSQDSRSPVTNNAGKKISFYPNPATSYITFDIPQKSFQKGLTLTVFNFLGKKIAETQTVNEKTVVSLTDFNRGTYIYHLIDRSGKMIDTGKFQVSK